MKRRCLRLAVLAMMAIAVSFFASAYDFIFRGVAYNIIEDSTAVEVTQGSLKTEVVIPDYVTYKGKDYPVTTIAANAFEQTEIRSVEIPNSVVSIGIGAFYDCDSLREVVFPESVKTIPQAVLACCDNLVSVTVAGAETINRYAFKSSSIHFLKISTTLKELAADALYDSSLRTLELIGEGEFDIRLTYGSDGKHQITYWPVGGVMALVVNEGVTRLPDFDGRLKPKHIFCYAAIPPAFDSTFANYDAAVHLPAGATGDFTANENWSKFSRISDDVAPLESFEITPAEMFVNYGDTLTFTANVQPEALYGDLVTLSRYNYYYNMRSGWNSNVYIPREVGDESIRLHCMDRTVDCLLHVDYPDFKLIFNLSELRLKQGETAEIKMDIRSDDGKVVLGLLKSKSSKMKIISSDPNVVKINDFGIDDFSLVRASIQGCDSGECDIIGSCEGKQVVCHVIVPDANDVNNDNSVDVGDVNAVLTTILEELYYPEQDVNNDKNVDVGDVNAILNAILKTNRSE